MNEKKKRIMVLILVVISVGILTINKSYSYVEKEETIDKKEVNKEQFAIYVDGQLSNDSTFPSPGYTLNMTNSKCVDNSNQPIQDITSVLKDNGNGTITVTSNKTIYCTLYFEDKTPPTVKTFNITGKAYGSFTLTSGYTHTKDVTYTIGFNDDDVASYCIGTSSDKNNCTSWANTNGQKSITATTPVLTTGDGNKTMYLFLQDKRGNKSEGTSKSIILDENNPTASIQESSKNTTSITVTVSGSDTNGINKDKMYCRKSGETSWNKTPTSGTCTISGLSAGTTYTIEAKVTDNSGREGTITKSITTTKTPGQQILDKKGTGGLSNSLFGGMYRYYGKYTDQVKNYICFGYSDSSTECTSKTSDKMYRIIGITPSGQMKIIKNNALSGGKQWHYNNVLSTDWSTSQLQQDLNGALYLNTLDSTWQKKIENHNWKYGGDVRFGVNESNSMTPKVFYDKENDESFSTIPLKISLMYVSDYLYSYQGLETQICYNSASGCDYSWLHVTKNGGVYSKETEWTMVRSVSTEEGRYYVDYAWHINTYGQISTRDLQTEASARPVFYLNSDIKLTGSGDGSEDKPYIVAK